jgi:hypothetical protein
VFVELPLFEWYRILTIDLNERATQKIGCVTVVAAMQFQQGSPLVQAYVLDLPRLHVRTEVNRAQTRKRFRILGQDLDAQLSLKSKGTDDTTHR